MGGTDGNPDGDPDGGPAAGAPAGAVPAGVPGGPDGNVRAYCTYLPEPDLTAAVTRLRNEAVAGTVSGVHRPGDGTATVVTDQVCRVTEGTLLARHLLERATDHARPEGPRLLELVLAAAGRPGRTLPDVLTRPDAPAAAIAVCDDQEAYATEAEILDLDLDLTDVDVLNSLHLRPPSAIRYRLPEGTRLDWVVRDATGDEWAVDVEEGGGTALPEGAGYVVHRTDPLTGTFAMEPATSYAEAVALARDFAANGFPRGAEPAHGFGNPAPEVVTVGAVRYGGDGSVEVVADGLATAERRFVKAAGARYVANVVRGERTTPRRTGWMLFGLTALPSAG